MQTVTVRDLYRRYPNDLTKPEICEILKAIGIFDPVWGEWDPNNHDKKKMIEIVSEHKLLIEKVYDIDLGSDYEEEEEIVEEPVMLTRYEVRYVGNRSNISHNSNTTHSGREYEFPRMLWVEVEELDWKHQYYIKVEGTVKAKVEPQWQVRKISPQGRLTNYFIEKVKKIMSKKPKKLADVKYIDGDRLTMLREYEIHTIRELISTPQLRTKEILKLDAPMVAEIYDDAKRAIV